MFEQTIYPHHSFPLIKIGLLLSLLTGCASAPLSPQLILPAARPDIRTTPSNSLAEFQTAIQMEDEKNYHLGEGDEITIDVWGHAELSGKHVIGPDGKITLPLVGPLRVTGLSREQAAQTVNTTLGPYYLGLSTTVKVERYASNRILVLGRVNRPGEVQFGMTSPSLLEAISLAGGVAEAPGLEGGQSLPFTRCAIFRGRDQIVWIELEPLFTGQDLSVNLKLQRNDIVYVPQLEEQLVYVLGEVHRPGAYRLTPNMSFLEALAKAGGPTIDAAPNRINLIRPTEGINQSLALRDLMTPRQKINVAVQEGDIIYVPTNTIAKLNYAIQFLTPFTTMLRMYADIESIRADRQNRQLDKQEEQLKAEQAKIEMEKAAIEKEKENQSGLE